MEPEATHEVSIQAAVKRQEMAAFAQEKPLHEANYRPDGFVTLTFRNVVSDNDAFQALDNFFKGLALKMLPNNHQMMPLTKEARDLLDDDEKIKMAGFNRHIFWFGYGDIQPTRGSNGVSVLHFHCFFEIEGGAPDWFVDNSDRVQRMMDSEWGEVTTRANKMKQLVPVFRRRGDVEYEVYVPEEGGIRYSRCKHGWYLFGEACSRSMRACSGKGHHGRKCKYVRNKALFFKRHRIT